MGNVVVELVEDIVLVISINGGLGGTPMATSSCWDEWGGEYILSGVGRKAL